MAIDLSDLSSTSGWKTETPQPMEVGGLRDIGALVDQVKSFLDRLEMQGKVHADVTIAHDALKSPISISLDIPLPPKNRGMAAQPTCRDDTYWAQFLEAFEDVQDNFAEVFTEVHQSCKGMCSDSQNAVLDEAVNENHPRLWHRLRKRAIHLYNTDAKKNGMEPLNPRGAIDWLSIKTWLKEHWPDIVRMFCSIIMVFLML